MSGDANLAAPPPPLPPAPAGDPLPYESSIAGALEPDERIVWEGQPIEAPPQSYWWGALVAMLVMPLVLAILIAVGTDDAPIALLGGVASIVPFGIIFALMIRSDRKSRRERAHGVYRVTDRRIQRITNLPGVEAAEATFDELARITVEHGPARDDLRATFNGVEF